MNIYNNSKIYKLINNISDLFYIGSTTKKLSQRLLVHKSLSNNTMSKTLFSNDAIVSIVLLENYPCNNKNELKLKEIEYIKRDYTYNGSGCLNKNIPFISNYGTTTDNDLIKWRKEYRDLHIEKMKAYHNIYKTLPHFKDKDKSYHAEYYIRQRTKLLFCQFPFQHQL